MKLYHNLCQNDTIFITLETAGGEHCDGEELVLGL